MKKKILVTEWLERAPRHDEKNEMKLYGYNMSLVIEPAMLACKASVISAGLSTTLLTDTTGRRV